MTIGRITFTNLPVGKSIIPPLTSVPAAGHYQEHTGDENKQTAPDRYFVHDILQCLRWCMISVEILKSL